MDKKLSFKQTLKIERERINDEMARHPEYLYDIGVKIEKLWGKVTQLENQLRDKEAKLSASTRNKYKRSKMDLTETAVKDLARADEECITLRNELQRWKKVYRQALLKKEVLKVKGEMMVNISHNVREEKKRSTHSKI